ncbi:MAG: hypothetical protein WC710_14140 [Gallionella sp.]
MLLTIIVDSEGRGIDNSAWIRSKMFPLREDVNARQITGAVDWLEGRGMLIRYQSKGRGYFYLPTFKQYQSGLDREAKSVLPTPEQLTTNSGVKQEEVLYSASASVVVSVVDDVVVLPEFEKTRKVIERETGLPGDGQNAVKAIDNLIANGCTEADIVAGIQWRKDEGKPITSYTQVVGPANTARLKRIQGGNGHAVKLSAYTDADGNVVYR